MKTQMIAFGAAFAMTSSVLAGAAAINEFHYDNNGGDVGEFVEIVLPMGFDPNNYTLELYNGNGGTVYNSFNVGADFVFHGTLVDGLDYYSISLPSNGIQNGSPDGLALSDVAGLIEFLSYEGTFDGVGGAADGVTSTDIGVIQGSFSMLGSSLQLFQGTWHATDGFNTQGMVNAIPAPGAFVLMGLAGLATGRRRRG